MPTDLSDFLIWCLLLFFSTIHKITWSNFQTKPVNLRMGSSILSIFKLQKYCLSRQIKSVSQSLEHAEIDEKRKQEYPCFLRHVPIVTGNRTQVVSYLCVSPTHHGNQQGKLRMSTDVMPQLSSGPAFTLWLEQGALISPFIFINPWYSSCQSLNFCQRSPVMIGGSRSLAEIIHFDPWSFIWTFRIARIVKIMNVQKCSVNA